MRTHTPESKQCLGKTNTIASPERKLRLSTKLLDVAVLSLTAAQSAGTYPYGGFLMSHVSTHTLLLDVYSSEHGAIRTNSG